MNRMRVLIVDDHALVREGLRAVLETQSDLVVVGEAGDGVEALDLARKLRPNIVLLDISMPRMSGLEAVPLLRKAAPEARIIVLSMHEKEAYASQLLRSGVHGYVLKGGPSSRLLEAIRCVAHGHYHFGGRMHGGVDEVPFVDGLKAVKSGFHSLSDREKQVFFLLIEGNTSPQISKILCVSEKTLEKHRASVCRKLGISSPVEMMKYAIRKGIVDPGSWRS